MSGEVLEYGRTDIVRWPPLRNLSWLTIQSITWFKAINQHLFYCTDEDRVFAMGQNDAGQLGLGHTKYVPQPEEIVELRGVHCLDIVGEFDYTFALTSLGRVYSWGQNKFNILGLPSVRQRLHPVQMLELSGIQFINTSSGHAVAVDFEGKVYFWGRNVTGQFESDKNGALRAVMQPEAYDDFAIKQACCGVDFVVLVHRGNRIDFVGTAKGAAFIKSEHFHYRNIKRVACTKDYVFILLETGELYSSRINVWTCREMVSNVVVHDMFLVDLYHDTSFRLYLISINAKAFALKYGEDGRLGLSHSRQPLTDTMTNYNLYPYSPMKMMLTYHHVYTAPQFWPTFNDKKTATIVFKFEDNSRIYAHRTTLRHTSNYLTLMLEEDWAHKRVVTITEFEHEFYFHYIKFMYEQQLPPMMDFDTLKGLFHIAHAHREAPLMDTCLELINTRFARFNIFTLFEFASKYSLQPLLRRIQRHARANLYNYDFANFESLRQHGTLMPFLRNLFSSGR